MIELGTVTEDEMVVEFLRADVSSRRYGLDTLQYVAATGLDRRVLIDEPDYASNEHRRLRAAVLEGMHGYATRTRLLFTGFPTEIEWRRVQLEDADLERLLYVNCAPWTQITSGPAGSTLRVVDGARGIPSPYLESVHDINLNDEIRALAEGIRRGQGQHAEIIAVASPNGWLMLLEGCARSTAHVLAGAPPTAIVGASGQIGRWRFYSAPPHSP